MAINWPDSDDCLFPAIFLYIKYSLEPSDHR